VTLQNPPLDSAAASRHLGVSKSTLEKLRVYGGGPKFLKLGRLVRYRIEDLEQWLAERVVTSTSDSRQPS
jgi:excisionase family DNA binding protein